MLTKGDKVQSYYKQWLDWKWIRDTEPVSLCSMFLFVQLFFSLNFSTHYTENKIWIIVLSVTGTKLFCCLACKKPCSDSFLRWSKTQHAALKKAVIKQAVLIVHSLAPFQSTHHSFVLPAVHFMAAATMLIPGINYCSGEGREQRKQHHTLPQKTSWWYLKQQLTNTYTHSACLGIYLLPLRI